MLCFLMRLFYDLLLYFHNFSAHYKFSDSIIYSIKYLIVKRDEAIDLDKAVQNTDSIFSFFFSYNLDNNNLYLKI